ncbi:MAG: glutamine synthetase [Candidatus Melainabacteria bacterium]|jgi:glutamine synthetase|nr:glutamine synthetase [Candidatus Melainabacteria bacterium]
MIQVRTLDDIVMEAQRQSINLVRFIYADLSSIIRGKATRSLRLKDRLESGIGLVKGTLAMNMLDQLQTDTGFGASGEIRLIPDPDTWTVLPYAERQAAVICDLMELDRTPWELCPRNVLKKQIARARDLGFSFQASFEPEFTIGTTVDGTFQPLDRSLCFSTEGMNKASRFINNFIDALAKQGIEVEQYYPELGHGQHEVSISHMPALKACDRQIFYRETLKGIALEMGMEAFLAPKPFEKQPGNGCHLHISAWDAYGERNLLFAESGLSPFGMKFVAGIVEHLPGLVALTAPSVNSYRRLQPSSWASAYTCWGFENREAAVRIPSVYWGQEMATTNIEVKCVDSTANPYLALAGVIAAGLDGVERNLTAPEPITCDPASLSDDEREANRCHRLPSSLMDALMELEEDKLLSSMLGSRLADTYCAVKTSECGAFGGANPEFEMTHHRNRY